MKDFFASMFEEMGARRKRLRAAFGDRGQALAEFLLLGGLLIGSLGLFVRPWMPGTSPWGFALPFVFVAGYFLIDARRQRAVRAGGDAEQVRVTYDWAVFLWALASALAGAAAFVLAWTAAPPPVESDPGWRPPAGSVDSTMVPDQP